jgi:hypothetical protein
MPEEETLITESIIVKREVEVIITPQALRILKEANKEVNEFVDWCLNDNKISFGGHNVMLYLEKKYERRMNP